MNISLPQTLTLAGKVVVDQRGGTERTAPADGTITDIKVPSGAFARKGDTVLTITGPDYIAAQTALIDGWRGNWASKPTSLEDMSSKIGATYDRLRELKFSREQVNAIRDAGTLYDPVPILMPRDGIVVYTAKAGQQFRTTETLFTFLSASLVSAPIAAEYADYLRPAKEFFVDLADGVVRRGILDSVAGDIQNNLREVHITVPDQVLPIGEAVTCSVKFLQWERIHPKATSKLWPYDTEARGTALAQVLRTLGVNIKPPVVRPSQPASVHNAAPGVNPFTSIGKAESRPIRSLALPLNPRLLPLSAQTLPRPSLPVGKRDFTELRLSTERVVRRDVTRHWSLWSEAILIEPNEATYGIRAEHNGFFEPVRRRRDDLLQAGMIVGSIVSSVPSNPVTGLIDSTAGITNAGVARQPTPVYANQDGILLCDLNQRRDVTQGDLLADVRPINMYLLRARLPVHQFSELPRLVEARLPKLATPYKSSASLITERSRTADHVTFDITVPAAAGHFNTGHFVEVSLADPTPRRDVLCIPNDCVVRIGCSTEVLVHSEIGNLTPVPVQCGQRYGDDIEIVTGLEEGHWVIRDLEALCSYLDVGAIMAGFWNPRA